ncbi:COA8 family protein CBG23705, mitochondrial isoform X2 [Venturia canescens]|uniref:COA8 family protein CBG23705, mitochondrial isoform X2 n=1 Tax=Venturia canescens TaxID=32260 RepID=UPI001C9BF9C4|nr:COA8 family protein CBG23705, mitochondrial isoform X2 [Venturia canescens]
MIKLNYCQYKRFPFILHFNYSSSTRPSSNLKSHTPDRKNVDMIGPPDPVSNLRPIIFAKNENETDLEKQYRKAREATQAWNQKFWAEHNRNFITERKLFLEALKQKTGHIYEIKILAQMLWQ